MSKRKSDSIDIKLLILDVIKSALEKDKRFKNVSMDNDHKSGEVIFTGPDNKDYIIRTNNITQVDDSYSG